jgi:biotin carboxyl carrier protein
VSRGAVAAPITGPVTTRCTVTENGVTRTFTVTVEPAGSSAPAAAAPAPAATAVAEGTPVYSTFAGQVEVVDILCKVGDTVTKGRTVAKIEAMKATHDIKAPVDGKVAAVLVEIGDEIDSSKAILTIA